VLRRSDPAAEAAHDDTYSIDDESLAAPEEPEPVAFDSSTAVMAANMNVVPATTTATRAAGGSVSGPESIEVQYRYMPACSDCEEHIPDHMPYAAEDESYYRIEYKSQMNESPKSLKGDRSSSIEAGRSEEQEWTGPDTSGKGRMRAAIKRNADGMFSPGAREGRFRFKPDIDTLEFRPTDANLGDFDPIEF
jgi:hypothetical protein